MSGKAELEDAFAHYFSTSFEIWLHSLQKEEEEEEAKQKEEANLLD
jgi:hypothetical protein